MDNKLIAEEMRKMVELDPRFCPIHDFFTSLHGVTSEEYISICRTQMPLLANVLLSNWPPMAGTKIIDTMRRINNYTDEGVVKVSAILLDIIVKSVVHAMEAAPAGDN